MRSTPGDSTRKPKLSQYDQQQAEKHKRAKKLSYKKKSKGNREHQ